MTEFNLFKEWARMVKANDIGSCTIKCETCGFFEPSGNQSCAAYVRTHPEEAAEIIRKWAEKHPRKTRQSEFLKMFPNAKQNASGLLELCPYQIDISARCDNKCGSCKEKYWLEEIE